jgi:L-lactate dehydrogenase
MDRHATTVVPGVGARYYPLPWLWQAGGVTDRMPAPIRVGVIGAGNVGATFAYSLVLSGVASEIVLVDSNQRRAEGEAMDLAHAVPFARPVRIWAGTLAECAGAAITVITAGAAQRPGESRLDLVRRNDAIIAGIIPELARVNPDGIVVMTANPVDVLTYRAIRLSGVPPSRVLGSGTILDTARFRALLAERFRVDPHSVHAYIVGEHGDSEVAVWSSANIAGMPIDDFCSAHGIDFSPEDRDDIVAHVRSAANDIIERKGATYYAVAAGLVRLAEAILRDQRTVLSVSSLVDDFYGISDVCLSLPTIVGRNGVEQPLRIGLSAAEAAGLRRSAGVLRTTLNELESDRPT